MNFTRTQIEPDLQCKLELLGRLGVDCGYQGTELHRHPFFEVFYISVGSFDIYFQQSSERVSKGDIFIISPDVLHRFVSTDGGEMLYAGISVTLNIRFFFVLLMPTFRKRWNVSAIRLQKKDHRCSETHSVS